jgi:hypothetical protein
MDSIGGTRRYARADLVPNGLGVRPQRFTYSASSTSAGFSITRLPR